MTVASAELFRGMAARKVVVVGDLMLDRFLWGRVQRVSPEAPVPVVDLERETRSAGGAANVARNLLGLGLQVALVGVTGADTGRDLLLEELTRADLATDGILIARDRGTTVKTRVVGNRRQMVRIDEERTAPLIESDRERLLATATAHLAQADALVLSDYAKGVLGRDLCRTLIESARDLDLPVLVDPKGKDFDRYAGATSITPNRGELALATGVDARDLEALLAAGSALRERLHLESLVLTLSEQGMVLIGPDGDHRLPAMAREVYDVSGAGDTVIATFAAGLVAGLGWVDTTRLANLAAGIVVGKVGTAPITARELLAAISEAEVGTQAAKIQVAEEAQAQVRRWQADGERVVFTNGCFDLLHVGHVTYLERARRQGRRLVVGLNTDASVRRLKGPERPLIGQEDRARVLAALAAVDAVVLFDQDTPLALIEQLRPDVLVKGADYREDQVVGAEAVKSRGGRVVLVPLVENRSTTEIITRLNGG
ncbi:MAG: D-glycero-beta-D-manno-heptose 1-phosphate adenylyltransferase (EC 2.7.7.70) / D-glycero-beta-D-manno-heptose-7-phosphate kinase (EC 2.7.1.167) [Olavius algarvensis Gamma 1 endosymbiont]|nr:MAG: D-glycero-beta-D-manno-heptose 1-phosphate adenylyltransferase (EC 2.7.7.70) / D-glycero-beta-D-manno-heptose-7-phosphate kinase (EC 2.7.1.167) [Olavius algarvensis Gamma 1 endosymbiont]